MAQGGQGSGDIIFSMCKIQKQVQGSHLVTNGSACIVKFPSHRGITPESSQSPESDVNPGNQTFVVTTTQVVCKADLTSGTPWTAQFLPNKWYKFSTEKFSLNSVPFLEMPIPRQEITLMLFPTEPLHDQKTLSRWRGNGLQSARAQLCHEEGSSKSELQAAADTKQELICFVLSETSSTDKFRLQYYVLSTDESGSHFLHPHGNKAKLKTLEDFQPTEKPMGSVILNEARNVVGFLAFGDKDEILPLFFCQNLQDSTQPSQGGLIKSGHTKETNVSSEGSSGDDDEKVEEGSNSSGRRGNASGNDANQNMNVTLVNTILQKFTKDSQQNPGPAFQGNEEIIGNQREPQEMSYVSHTGGGSGSGDSKDTAKTDAKDPPYKRSYTAQPEMTPRTRRRFLKSQSVMTEVPLKEGTFVAKVILGRIYIMDTLGQYLDPSYRGLQNWRHLAELNKVSTDLLKERHSRSEEMFKVVASNDPDLTIGTVKSHLRNLKINEVMDYIQNLGDHIRIEDFLESQDPNIPGRVFLNLDRLSNEKWKSLGIKLGVAAEDLNSIKIHCANQCQNPAEEVIEVIYRSNPSMTMRQFKGYLTKIKRNDVKNKLDDLKDTLTIEDLHDDLDLMRVTTSMLNGPNNSRIKNYRDLADVCGVSSELYQSLQPPCDDSPTAIVLEEIVRQRPTFTVEDFFINLRDMKRPDAIKGISCYFVEEDMKAMKRKLRITDE